MMILLDLKMFSPYLRGIGQRPVRYLTADTNAIIISTTGVITALIIIVQ